MWAYPNFIPLEPSILLEMWKRLEPYDFYAVHSLFVGRDVRGPRLKGEVLDDMKLQARFQGYKDGEHAIFDLKWDGRESQVPAGHRSQLATKQAAHSALEGGF
jgi:hypothetical protein